jgi:hypothetical protein
MKGDISVNKQINILSRVGVTYKTGFGLDDWIYCTLYIHTVRDYRQYGAIAILHTLQFTVTHALGFSVFTSRILATDLSQSHCHFKSHMKSSFHNLNPFFPLFCNCQLNSIPLLPSSYPSVLAFRNSTQFYAAATNSFGTLLYNHFVRTTQKIRRLYCLEGVFTLPLHSNGSYSIVACLVVAAGMCLLSRCLAMNVFPDFAFLAFGRHVTI